MATSLSETIAKIILRNKIHMLELNIKDEEDYLQRLEVILQPVIQAKEILDRAITMVKENEDIEKKESSRKQDPEWCKEVEEAKEIQCRASQNYGRHLNEGKPALEKYEVHKKKLEGFETEYKETVRLLANLSRSWQKAETVSTKKEEEALAEEVTYFNEQRLPLKILEEQASTKVYLHF